MQVQENISLKPYNTFGIGAMARYFSSFHSTDELIQLTTHHLPAGQAGSPLTTLILGGGSNILFTKDFDGIVLKNEISGTIVFLFQPAEEGAPNNEEGGAPLMIKEGALENPKPDAIFGIHIESFGDNGKIYYKPEAFMASADFFTIKVKGKQSHGAYPWDGVDPIYVSAQIIQGSRRRLVRPGLRCIEGR